MKIFNKLANVPSRRMAKLKLADRIAMEKGRHLLLLCRLDDDEAVEKDEPTWTRVEAERFSLSIGTTLQVYSP